MQVGHASRCSGGPAVAANGNSRVFVNAGLSGLRRPTLLRATLSHPTAASRAPIAARLDSVRRRKNENACGLLSLVKNGTICENNPWSNRRVEDDQVSQWLEGLAAGDAGRRSGSGSVISTRCLPWLASGLAAGSGGLPMKRT